MIISYVKCIMAAAASKAVFKLKVFLSWKFELFLFCFLWGKNEKNATHSVSQCVSKGEMIEEGSEDTQREEKKKGREAQIEFTKIRDQRKSKIMIKSDQVRYQAKYYLTNVC